MRLSGSFFFFFFSTHIILREHYWAELLAQENASLKIYLAFLLPWTENLNLRFNGYKITHVFHYLRASGHIGMYSFFFQNKKFQKRK